jgi:hypothetical protein
MIPLDGLGLVLRRAKIGEEDLRLTVLLRESGKLLAVAKGGLRPQNKLRALQEPFTEADFHLFVPSDHGVNARLAGGKLVDSHQGLRTRYDAFETASRTIETVEALLPFRAPAPDVYDILRSALRALSAGQPAAEEWVLFVARLLRCLGHGDVTDRLVALLEPSERETAEAALETSEESALHVRPASLERCQHLVDAELELILPWRLKSDRVARESAPVPDQPADPTSKDLSS